MRTLVVTCHPDDETLFAMGYISRTPGVHVCCCSVPRKDPERIVDFFAVCKELGAHPIVAGALSHAGRLDVGPAAALARVYDQIVTHNPNGEYGHPAHIAVHDAMAATGKPMWVFGAGYKPTGMLAQDYPVDIERKKELLAMYRTRPDVFANQSKNFDLSVERLIKFR